MIRVADVVMHFLRDRGITHVFMVSGGGIMHLTDALGSCEGLRYVCNNNEAASAICAEAFARVTGGPGVALVTTGPGSTNALASVPGAYVDSIPMFVISGQVRRAVIADYDHQRQNGPQEININDMARPVTKYCVTIDDPLHILAEMETAYAYATSGRPGPVWINIPLDVQSALVDEGALEHAPPADRQRTIARATEADIATVVEHIKGSSRPLLIGGSGVRLAGAAKAFSGLASQLTMPAVLTIGAMDLIPESHPSFAGRFGPVGQRRANFAVQNADLILSIGASMNISSIGFATDFAPHAKRIMVNVDRSELEKLNYVPDLKIESDAKNFIEQLSAAIQHVTIPRNAAWQEAIVAWRHRYPVIEPSHYREPTVVNSYLFVDTLCARLSADDIVLSGNSLDAVSMFQVLRVRDEQRAFTNVNYGAMGWDLPAAVGAAAAAGGRRVVLITGDGSLQFNVQELMTAVVNQLRLAIFVLNNDGYQSIRTTQNTYFDGRFVGADFKSGIANPNFQWLASAFGLAYCSAERQEDVDAALDSVFACDGPVICELRVSPFQERIPRSSSSRKADGTLESQPLHNMYPFLPAEEVEENMSLSRVQAKE